MLICGLPEAYWWLSQGTHPSKLTLHGTFRFILYLIWYPLIGAQVILFSFADKPGQDVYKRLHKQENDSPETHCSFTNRQTLWWFNRICAIGAKKPLEVSDLYSLNPDDTSAYLVPKWSSFWDPAVTKYMDKKKEIEAESRISSSRRGSAVGNGSDATGTTPLLSANVDRIGIVGF